MFVITADQVDSRHSPDLVGETVARLSAAYADGLVLPVDRNAGDELQALVRDADTAVAMVLDLTRIGSWSVGLGSGEVEHPLAASTRESRGAAFISARDAVTSAKRSPLRFSFRAAEVPGSVSTAADFEALMLLLLAVRDRRTEQGWQVYDLLRQGQTQRGAAAILEITPQAVSDRMSVAQVKIDLESHTPLARLLERCSDAAMRPEDGSKPRPPAKKGSATS